MTTASPFDPTHSVRFDLAAGVVHAAHGEGRLLLVPSSAVEALIQTSPPEAVDAFARALGAAVGARAAGRMGASEEQPVDVFVTHLAGELALMGVGALAIERWGRAMVVVVDGAALPERLLAPLVASALGAATGRAVQGTLLAREGSQVRILVSSEKGAERVRNWMASGVSWGEALGLLQGANA